MTRIHRVVLALVAAGCGVVLGLSVWPAAAAATSVFVLGGALAAALLVSAAALIVVPVLLWRRAKGRPAELRILPLAPPRFAGRLLAVVGVTGAALLLQLPRRAAFALSRSELERVAAQVPPSHRARVERRVGAFPIEEVVTDADGVVWLLEAARTGFLDVDFHGLVLGADPSTRSSPYGQGCELRPLWGRWSTFEDHLD